MKKTLLVLCALVTVLSGVAMVSAYEAHTVNVKAHVENAMVLEDGLFNPFYEYDFGTVFPEEWMLRRFWIKTSTSFCDTVIGQDRHDNTGTKSFSYKLYVAKKDGGYKWLGDALYFTVYWPPGMTGTPPSSYWAGPGDPTADNMRWVGQGLANPAQPPDNPIFVLSGTLVKEYGLHHVIIMGLDVPVFEYYWNELTDVDAKPSGKADGLPTVVIDKEDDPDNRWDPSGVNLGVEIKIQITNIGL